MGYALEELGPDRCKQIAEGLFKVDRVYGGVKLNGWCPIHGDEKSPSFVYHSGEDWYKCRSCSAGGDLVNLWCHVHGLDSKGEGFKRFKEEYVELSPSTTKKKPNLHLVEPPAKHKPASLAAEVFVAEEDLASLPPLPAGRVTELRRTRGWTESVIRALDLREFDDGRGNLKIAMPIRDDQGRLGNIRLYQPGADRFKVISWYDRKCRACGGAWAVVKKTKTCKECGGHPNDYGRTRLYPAPSNWKKDGALWLCEGEPDMICALSQGLNAVTQTAGCGTWRDGFSEAMAGRDVVICYDADQAGWKGSDVAAKSLVQHAKGVRVLRWPELMGVAG